MSTEPQGPWAKAMEKVGAADPRNGRLSWNALSELSGVSTSTITKMVAGRSRPSVSTITKVADALRVDPDTVRSWLPGARRVVTRYQVPDAVHLLTPRQQDALTEFIRAIAVEQEGGDAGGDTAAIKGPRLVEPTSQGPFDSRSASQAAAREVKKGSAGQRARAAQDADAEGPQD